MTLPSSKPLAKPAPSSTVLRREQLLIVDTRNMMLLWLEEKIARNELTLAQADGMLSKQENHIKLWGGPIKDGIATTTLFHKIAKDFGSWKGARVHFSKSKAGTDLVTFKGWPNGRKVIRGTRYRLDNPKIIELQIGRPGIRAAARESACFGLGLVVLVDMADLVLRDNSTLGQVLGNLTVDIPSTIVASAIGAVAGSAFATTSVAGLAMIGSLAVGPFVVAFVVGAAVAGGLWWLDQHFRVGERLGEAYDEGLGRLTQAWEALGVEAEARFHQLANSQMVHDLKQNADTLTRKIARQADQVRGELAHLL